MERKILDRERKFINNGWAAYVKRLLIMGVIGGVLAGLLIGFSVYQGNNQFSPNEPILGEICLIIIGWVAAMAFLAIVIAYKTWVVHNFSVWRVIGQDLYFEKTTIQEIESRFGIPKKREERNNAVYYYYYNTFDTKNDIRIKYVKFKFKNNLMVEYNR